MRKVFLLAAALATAAPVLGAMSVKGTAIYQKEALRIDRDGQGYHLVRLAGTGISDAPGAPQLPVDRRYLPLPPGAVADSVKVINIKSEDIDGSYLVFPAQPQAVLSDPSPRTEFTLPDKRIYQAKGLYPATVCELRGSGSLAGSVMAGLLINPVLYQPATGKMELITRIDYEVFYHTDRSKYAPRNSLTENGRRAREVAVRALTGCAPAPSREKDLPSGAIEYLIVTKPPLDTVFQRLADWKTAKGVPAAVRSVDWIAAHYPGTDLQERIRRYLKNVYSDSGLIYVLLGGDSSMVPIRNAYAMYCDIGTRESRHNNFPCDLYYSDLDGTWNENDNAIYGELGDGVDLYPDVMVGRAPAGNITAARALVNKLLTYEQSPPADYLLKALFDADILWPGTDEAVAKDLIDLESIPDRFIINKLYASLGLGSASYDSINAGRHLINHCGHGGVTGGLIWTSQADALTNDPRNGIHFSIGCWTNAFDYSDAVSSHFVNNPNGGGVAYIGNSSYGWGCPGYPAYGYSDLFDAAFFRELFVDDFYRIGQALGMAKASYIAQSGEENVYRWHQYDLNLLGDPEMPVWTDTPETLTVDCPQKVMTGAGRMLVKVSHGAMPIGGALVCLTKGSEVYSRGYTLAGGEVLLEVAPSTPGQMELTATAHNFIPCRSSVAVGSSLAYPLVCGYAVSDTSGGNGDGIANPGETVDLALKIVNYGDLAANNISGSLSCHDTMAVLTDSQQYYGTIAAGDSNCGTFGYRLVLSPNITDGHQLVFGIGLTDGASGSWTSPITFPVAGPSLALGRHVIDDSSGNSNGLADPGETVGLRLAIQNLGRGAAPATACSLSTSDTSLILLDTTGMAGTVPAGAETSLVFRVQVSPGAASPHIGLLKLRIAPSSGTAFIDSLPLVIGRTGFTDSMESDTCGWTHGGTNDSWHITDHRHGVGHLSWYCGLDSSWQYPDNCLSWLLSPSFMLGPDSKLTFWRYYGLALYGTDGLFTEIYYKGKWDTLGFICSGGALSQMLGLAGEWAEEGFDLSRYGYGDTARIRFTFISDNSTTSEGFYLDGFSVSAGKGSFEVTSIKLLTPNGGECLSGPKNVRWSLKGAVEESVAILIDCSRDDGISWRPLARLTPRSPEWEPCTWVWNTPAFPNGDDYKMRISLTNGADTLTILSQRFTVYNDHETVSSKEHLSGGSNTLVLNPYIVDASLLNGHRYELRFKGIIKDPFVGNDYTPVYSFDLWDATSGSLVLADASFSCPQTSEQVTYAPDPVDGVVPELSISVDRSGFLPLSFIIKNDVNLARPASADTLRVMVTANVDQHWPWRGADYEIRWHERKAQPDTLDTLWAEVWDATNGVPVPLDSTCGWGSMRKSAWAFGPTATSKGTGWVTYGWPSDTNSYIYICGSRFYFNRSVIPRKMTWATRPEEGEVWSASTSGGRPPHDGDVFSYTASKAAPDTGGPAHGLFQNRPNPFSGTAVIYYRLSRATRVRIRVYNIAGQRVATLADEVQTPGLHTVSWKGRDDRGRSAATGFYFYRMETEGFSQTKKMLLLK